MNKEFKDLLNLDIEHIEPIPLSTEQKMNIKNNILSKNKGKKHFHGRSIAVAAIFSLSVITASFMTMPAIANQIPFVQSILTYFENDTLSSKYSDIATIVNQVQSSNGIDVMIEDAVYDGSNIMLTYAIQTEIELGDNPFSKSFLEIEEASGIGGTASIKKINDTTYVGVEKVTPHFTAGSPEKVNIQWEPRVFENLQTNEQFEGDWKFEFMLEKVTTNVQVLNQVIEQDGIELVLKSLEFSDLSAVLDFDFFVEESKLQNWPFVSIEMIEVKDNFGNVYKAGDNGGVSYDNGASNERSVTIYSIDPDATLLTLTPQVYYSKGSGELLKKATMQPIKIDLN